MWQPPLNAVGSGTKVRGSRRVVAFRQGEGVEVRGASQSETDSTDATAVIGVAVAEGPVGGRGGGYATDPAAAAVAAVRGLEGEAGSDAPGDQAVADGEGRLQGFLLV